MSWVCREKNSLVILISVLIRANCTLSRMPTVANKNSMWGIPNLHLGSNDPELNTNLS